MTTYLIPSLIILALVVVNGLFVAAEFALVAARKARMGQICRGG